MYTYGEIGYEIEDSRNTPHEAIVAAVIHSVAMGTNPIGIWDENENLIMVVVEGDVFELKNKN
jgi:hypothetical protein